MIKKLLSVLLVFALFGCDQKNKDELFNKPDIFWYQQIIKDIDNKDLESADAHFASLSSEHIASPLIENALIILAQAHMEEEEYIVANDFLDLYIKRYGSSINSEYAKFLKIKANFLSFTYPDRNQDLLINTIEQIKEFLNDYPESDYRPLIETILVKMELGRDYLNKRIHKLYKRIDKPESAKIYQQKLDNSDFKDANLIDPKNP